MAATVIDVENSPVSGSMAIIEPDTTSQRHVSRLNHMQTAAVCRSVLAAIPEEPTIFDKIAELKHPSPKKCKLTLEERYAARVRRTMRLTSLLSVISNMITACNPDDRKLLKKIWLRAEHLIMTDVYCPHCIMPKK